MGMPNGLSPVNNFIANNYLILLGIGVVVCIVMSTFLMYKSTGIYGLCVPFLVTMIMVPLLIHGLQCLNYKKTQEAIEALATGDRSVKTTIKLEEGLPSDYIILNNDEAKEIIITDDKGTGFLPVLKSIVIVGENNDREVQETVLLNKEWQNILDHKTESLLASLFMGIFLTYSGFKIANAKNARWYHVIAWFFIYAGFVAHTGEDVTSVISATQYAENLKLYNISRGNPIIGHLEDDNGCYSSIMVATTDKNFDYVLSENDGKTLEFNVVYNYSD